ncbi:Patatin-like phospholipase domain protein [Quillaja saponaria]|uniref:Patatin-like phospholipase domain protein n=1 Tax=Quillaja saponaria TaxID=32244 RepID=A0AAD7P7R2_QUISA|nr:Patatin-like phospholipase domain protein [Quillaja saponaria]
MDFNFWDSSNTLNTDTDRDQLEGSKLNSVAHVEEDFGACSPDLWETNKVRHCKNTYSPLHSHDYNHDHSSLSPTSRRQAIIEGKRQLMGMIQDLPESCCELSLKDMVDSEEAVLEVPEKTVIDDTSTCNTTKVQFGKQIKKKKNKSNKKNQILRAESFDRETFLLKMFLPTSLAKKKAKVGKHSMQQTTKQLDKDCWIRRFFAAGENRKSIRSNISGSTSISSNNNNISRYTDRNLSPGCWPFFHNTKSRIKQGCIF